MNKLWMVLLLALAGCHDGSMSTSVLMEGDSINQGDAPYVAAPGVTISIIGDCPYFQDRTATGNNGGSSKRLAACMPMWLSGQHFDEVYFNAGMHDVYVKGCGIGSASHEVELSDYLANLQSGIDAIRQSGAEPVFMTTTPVEGEVHCHFNSDIVSYNAAAVGMMQSQGIKIVDQYSVMYPVQEQYHLPNNIHFTEDGYKILAASISASISH